MDPQRRSNQGPAAGETADPCRTLAMFYDLEYTFQDDIPLFLGLAERTGGPILELGAGTGRVAVPLARAGFSVVGLERSPAMLEVARRKLRGRAGRRVTLTQGDMRSFDLPSRFPLAVIPDNTFAWLLAKGDQRSALECIHAHLQPGGLLAIVLQNPYHLVLEPPAGEVLLVWAGRPEDGQTVKKFWSARAGLAEQLLDIHIWYDVAGRDGSVIRHPVDMTLRWFYRPELELLLESCGFVLENLYGSYDLDPYDADSPLLIAIATRP